MLNAPNTALPWYDVCLELLLLDFNNFTLNVNCIQPQEP